MSVAHNSKNDLLKVYQMETKNLDHIAIRQIEEVIRVGWTEIGLGSLELKDLPKEIGELVILRRLILSYNNLTSLPPEIGNLINLDAIVGIT